MNELYHHGILGQKWGQRNGPPYPLDASDKSASEKKEISSDTKFQYNRLKREVVATGQEIEDKSKKLDDLRKEIGDLWNGLGAENDKIYKDLKNDKNFINEVVKDIKAGKYDSEYTFFEDEKIGSAILSAASKHKTGSYDKFLDQTDKYYKKLDEFTDELVKSVSDKSIKSLPINIKERNKIDSRDVIWNTLADKSLATDIRFMYNHMEYTNSELDSYRELYDEIAKRL